MTAIDDLTHALRLLKEHRATTPGLGGIEFLVNQAYNKLTRAESDKWFHDRIGKVVFREDNGCSCDTCRDVFKNGILIQDEQHANYLASASAEMGVKYFDK